MNFVNATLKSVESIEEINPNSKSKLTTINPQAKIISLVIVLILMVSLRSIWILFLLVFFLSIEALMLERDVFKTWLFVPLFTGIIAIPAIFITPGVPIFEYNFIKITKEGIIAALDLFLRALISVTALSLLTKTTLWDDIIDSLKLIKIPSMFLLILFLTFRYIFFFIRVIEKTLLSIKSKAVGKEKARESWKIYAPLVGNVFVKSYEMQEKVYISMKARGFMIDKEEFGFLDRSKKFNYLDWTYVTIYITLAFILFLVDGDLPWIS